MPRLKVGTVNGKYRESDPIEELRWWLNTRGLYQSQIGSLRNIQFVVDRAKLSYEGDSIIAELSEEDAVEFSLLFSSRSFKITWI